MPRITVFVLLLLLGTASISASGARAEGAAAPAAHRVTAYELTGRRDDGAAVTIDVRDRWWEETVTSAPGVVTRLIVDPARVVRYGMFGDVYVADRGAATALRIRAALLTGGLPPPTASVTMPGPGGALTRYDQYRRMDAVTLELKRVKGRLTEATMDGWFDYRGFRLDERGVVTGWRSPNGDSFAGVRAAAAPPLSRFAEPPAPKLEDGDPTAAEVDGVPIKVLIDTGTEGLGVSPALAARGAPVNVSLSAMGVAGTARERIVRFTTFRQLGVTRSGQLAHVTAELPEGYDAIEGIGMFPGLALHVAGGNAVLADRHGCRGGLTFSSWAGVVTAIVRVTNAPIPFDGWALFDTGLDGEALQVTYPPRLAGLVQREHLTENTYTGIGGSAKAHCTTRPVTFLLKGLGGVSHPLCYVADAFANTLGPAVHSSLVVNPVEFLGAPATIDDQHKLICRTPR